MLEKYDVYLRPFDCQRTLHIYLPNDYYQSDERYPVVYMFDGHNLFLNSDATYGKSWGLAEFLDHYDKKLIIVGIECNHEGNERLSEYCPYSLNSRYFGRVQGKGIQTLDWLVYELKPMIDQKYRTYPFRECTALAGSSMGGLMAFVIGLMIMAEFLLIHSRIQAEKEENSRVVCSLRMLGMIDKEMVKCLCYKNFLRFIPPSVVGTILSFLSSYYLNESYGMGTNGILAGIVFGVILTVGIFVVIRRYSEKEEKLYESGFMI